MWLKLLLFELTLQFFKSLLQLTLYLLTWRIWWAQNNVSKWQMGFNAAFQGLKCTIKLFCCWLLCPNNYVSFFLQMKQVLHSHFRCLVFALWINTLCFNLCLFLALPIVTDHFLIVFGLDLLGVQIPAGAHRLCSKPSRPATDPTQPPGGKMTDAVDLSPPSSGEVNSNSAPSMYYRCAWKAKLYLLRELSCSGSLRSE